MKSKITIDLDEDNQPIIVINYESSEDVRDKMVKKFLEDIGERRILEFKYFETNNKYSKIRPIKHWDMRKFNNYSKDYVQRFAIDMCEESELEEKYTTNNRVEKEQNK